MYIPYNAENIHPGFSIDCVILTFHKGKIKILLNKFSLDNYWALPGGFMFNTENADEAVYRILKNRTGQTDIFLKQFYLFSDVNRTMIEQNVSYVSQNMANKEEGDWLLRRYISLGYYALVRYDSVKLDKADGQITKWYSVDDLPELYSDHENIIKTALETIRNMLPIIPVGYLLLPEKFTISELRKIYEVFLGKTLDRRNFQRKILSQGAVIQLNERKNIKTYNPPYLYSYNLCKKDIFE